MPLMTALHHYLNRQFSKMANPLGYVIPQWFLDKFASDKVRFEGNVIEMKRKIQEVIDKRKLEIKENKGKEYSDFLSLLLQSGAYEDDDTLI